MTKPRFLCDEMLGQLCRYLRAAGYDTLLANGGRPDREWLQLCQQEQRLFLTQDRRIGEHKAAQGIAVILPHGDIEHLAAMLGERCHINWVDEAFSRCLMDNTPLQEADEAAKRMAPADALRPGEPVKHCPACGRIYWQGSHYRRMRARLARWQAAK